MAQSLTEWLQTRLTVVEVNKERGLVRVRGQADACSDLTCDGTLVVANEGASGGLEALNPGDIVRVETNKGRTERIIVVRRVWEELTSPEF